MEAPSRTLVVVSWGWGAGWEQPLKEACLCASSLLPCLLPFLPCLCVHVRERVCMCVSVRRCLSDTLSGSLCICLPDSECSRREG